MHIWGTLFSLHQLIQILSGQVLFAGHFHLSRVAGISQSRGINVMHYCEGQFGMKFTLTTHGDGSALASYNTCPLHSFILFNVE